MHKMSKGNQTVRYWLLGAVDLAFLANIKEMYCVCSEIVIPTSVIYLFSFYNFSVNLSLYELAS